MDRSTYDKMKYINFHLLIGILVVSMLYQSANDFHLLIGILVVFMLYQSANDNLRYLR